MRLDHGRSETTPCSMRPVCPGLHFGTDACHARNKKRTPDDVIAKASRKLPFSAPTPARFFSLWSSGGEGGVARVRVENAREITHRRPALRRRSPTRRRHGW